MDETKMTEHKILKTILNEFSVEDLSSLLRKMKKDYGISISGFSTLKKDELIKLLIEKQKTTKDPIFLKTKYTLFMRGLSSKGKNKLLYKDFSIRQIRLLETELKLKFKNYWDVE